MINTLKFDQEAPSFYLMNVGETHYPYTIPGETAEDLPILHGVHGVFKHMDDDNDDAVSEKFQNLFTGDRMNALKDKQRKNVEYLDGLFEKLYEVVPQNTYVMVTADHGELFGEDGFFGHGPILHEKVFEVPFIEGRFK
jgi:hypothetical protein